MGQLHIPEGFRDFMGTSKSCEILPSLSCGWMAMYDPLADLATYGDGEKVATIKGI